MKTLTACLLVFLSKGVFGAHECVWITGHVNCQHDPSKNLNVEIRVYDRDSTLFLLKMIDPDDLMGVTFTSENGLFSLDGCGDDFDWIPGMSNKPEPYIQIRHYCNKAEGETITLPEFSTFVPNTYELGIIELDSPSNGGPKANLKTNRA